MNAFDDDQPAGDESVAGAAPEADGDGDAGEVEDEAGRTRRQNVRVSVKYPITVKIAGLPDYIGRTRDISATGVGFATRAPLEVDMEGTVSVEFPTWKLTKQFVVRFVRPILAGRQVGVQYSELTHDEHEQVVKEVFTVQREQLQSGRTAG